MKTGKTYKRYTPEFKGMVIRRIREAKMAYNEAEREYGIAHGKIYYNFRRIKIKLKGLPPAIHRQLAFLAA